MFTVDKRKPRGVSRRRTANQKMCVCVCQARVSAKYVCCLELSKKSGRQAAIRQEEIIVEVEILVILNGGGRLSGVSGHCPSELMW